MRVGMGSVASDVLFRAIVMGDLARQEVELAAVGFLDGMAVDHVLGMAVDVHAAVDADERIAFARECHEIVGDGDHRESEAFLQPAQE